jgi:hypothetical protein
LNGARVYGNLRRLRSGPPRDYGLGRRETALRSARALTDKPISASSAAAWTAVPMMSAPVAGTGLRGCGVGGVPAGWGGWRSRSALGLG